jgi:hypothetical protein
MRNSPLILAAILTCVGTQAEPSQRAVSAYTWTEDFQGDSLGQFASYPPVQDVGYDPSLSPATEFGARGGRALMRILKPTRAGKERFGFIRRLDLLTAEHARFNFAYWINNVSPGDLLEIGIDGADGKRYTTTIGIEPGGGWRTVQVTFAQLLDDGGRPAAIHTGIKALFIVANLPHADPDVTYRFLIDDLKLEAAREMRFDVKTPSGLWIAHWPELFSSVSSEVGQPVPIEAAAPLPLRKAECVVKDQDGRIIGNQPLYDDSSHGDRNARDGVWSNNSVLSRETGGPGVYYLQLRGIAEDGRSISTELRLLRPTSRASAHPRLFFGREDRDKLVARMRDPKYAGIWRGLEERARASRNTRDVVPGSAIFAMLDPVHLLPTLPGYFDIITKAGACIQLNALHAYLTGDAESRQSAKSALLAVAQWNTWAPPWFQAHGQHTYYPAGLLAAQTAFGYDLLYDELSPNERQLVRKALLEYGIARAYREYVLDNRILANTSNWLAHTVGGALIGSAAMWNDEPVPELALYTNGLLKKLEEHLAASYLADGSYGEGISYQEFDLETSTVALIALERVFGFNYWDRSHVKDSLWYPISTLAKPISGSLDMGDTHYPAGHSIAPVVAQSRNPVFRWFYDLLDHNSLHDFLFADFSLPSQPPDAPGSRYFPQKGAVVFRTGWGEDDAILLYRAGPNFNHNHADQGSFLIRALGEELVTEGGYADYYKDPYYDSYFKQAIGHNTVLVDHDPESQEIAGTLGSLSGYPKITDVILSRSFDSLSSELQQVYRDRLRRFCRRVLFVKPEYFVIYDELAGNREPAQFDWLLHLPDRARVKADGSISLYRGSKSTLAVQKLLPADAAVHVENGHLRYSTFNPAAPPSPPEQPAILELSTKAPVTRTAFLVILAPTRTEEDARKFTSALQPIDNSSWAGFESRGERDDLLLFLKPEPPREATYGEWSTDAAVWFHRRVANRDNILAAQTVTTLKRSGRVLFAADRAVSFVAEYRGDQIEVAVNSREQARVEIARTNGELAGITVAAGQQTVTVR